MHTTGCAAGAIPAGANAPSPACGGRMGWGYEKRRTSTPTLSRKQARED